MHLKDVNLYEFSKKSLFKDTLENKFLQKQKEKQLFQTVYGQLTVNGLVNQISFSFFFLFSSFFFQKCVEHLSLHLKKLVVHN